MRQSARSLVACAPHVWQDFEAKLEEESEQASPPQPEPAQAGAPGMAPPSQGDQDDDEDGEQADSSAGAQQAKWEVRCALCGLYNCFVQRWSMFAGGRPSPRL